MYDKVQISDHLKKGDKMTEIKMNRKEMDCSLCLPEIRFEELLYDNTPASVTL